MATVDSEARRQDILVRAALALASELSLPVVLQLISDLAAEVADARYAALGVVGAQGKIDEFVTHGLSDEERARIGRLPEGHGILGALITDARPLRLPRLQDDPRSIGFPPNHPPMTTFLGVPIAIRGKVFGNLYLTEKKDGALFTQDDEDAVVKLAAQAAVAIDNARLYHEAESSGRQLAAINEVARSILEGRDVEEVFRLIAFHARSLANARLATVVTPYDDEQLTVRVAYGEGAEVLEGSVLPLARSLSGEVMRTGQPVAVADAAADPRAQQRQAEAVGAGPAILVPLAVRDQMFGTLAVANRAGDDAFSSEDLEILQIFASQAAVALEHARMTEELQRLALIEDRERIAKELHDDIVQSLFAEGMALQASLSILHDVPAMEERITQSVENIDRVIRDLRNYIFGLRPGAVADRQLERSLRELVAGLSHGGEIAIEVETDSDATSRLSGRSAAVLAATREAVSNAIRHAGADHVRVTLMSRENEITLEIEDNGKGVDVADGRGNELGDLAARAKALGGRLDVDSEPGRGTVIRISIPR